MLHTELLYNIRELLKLSEIYLSHAPKHEKYVSVKMIKTLTWDMYLYTVKACKKYHKKTILSNLDITHEQLRCAWQLYYELGYLAFKDGHHDSNDYANHRFSVINLKIDGIGKQIGAWIKSVNESN